MTELRIRCLGGQENGREISFEGEPPQSLLFPEQVHALRAIEGMFPTLLYVKRQWQDLGGKRTPFYVLDGTSDAEAERLMRSAVVAPAEPEKPKGMTYEEAKALKSFKNYCQCGGYAWSMNGRPQSAPHMNWCPQAVEYAEWWAALHPSPGESALRRMHEIDVEMGEEP